MNIPGVRFSVRHLNPHLRDRLRVYAILTHVTMEDALNDILKRGLNLAEADLKQRRGKKAS